jgi:hypothetical protein
MAANRHVLEPNHEVIREHLRWLERLDGRSLSDKTTVGRLVLRFRRRWPVSRRLGQASR